MAKRRSMRGSRRAAGGGSRRARGLARKPLGEMEEFEEGHYPQALSAEHEPYQTDAPEGGPATA